MPKISRSIHWTCSARKWNNKKKMRIVNFMNSSTWTRIIRFHFCYRNIVLFLFLWEFSAFTPTDAVNGVAITHSDTRKKNIKIPRTHRKSSLNIIIYRHHTPNETCYTFTHSRRTHISATTHSVHMAGLRNSHIKQQYFFFFFAFIFIKIPRYMWA